MRLKRTYHVTDRMSVAETDIPETVKITIGDDWIRVTKEEFVAMSGLQYVIEWVPPPDVPEGDSI